MSAPQPITQALLDHLCALADQAGLDAHPDDLNPLGGADPRDVLAAVDGAGRHAAALLALDLLTPAIEILKDEVGEASIDELAGYAAALATLVDHHEHATTTARRARADLAAALRPLTPTSPARPAGPTTRSDDAGTPPATALAPPPPATTSPRTSTGRGWSPGHVTLPGIGGPYPALVADPHPADRPLPARFTRATLLRILADCVVTAARLGTHLTRTAGTHPDGTGTTGPRPDPDGLFQLDGWNWRLAAPPTATGAEQARPHRP